MLVILDNKKGYAALIGLLVVILLVAVLIYGGSFFSKNSEGSIENSLEAKSKAEGLIENINKSTEERKEALDERLEKSEVSLKFDIETNIGNNAILTSPLKIEGSVNKEIGELVVELKDKEKNSKVKEFSKTKAGTGDKNIFTITIYYQFLSTNEGYLTITDANDERNFIEIPVKYSQESENN